MSSRSKLILYAVIAIVVIVALVLVLHLLLSGSGNTTPGTGGTTGTLPQVGTQTGSGTGAGAASSTTVGTFPNGSLTGNTSGGAGAPVTFGILGNEPVADYFVNASGSVLDIEPNGTISEMMNGQATFLSSSAVQNFIAGGFSYDGAKAVISFGDPQNPQTSVFDVTTETWTPLATGLISPVWSPADYRIAYLAPGANGTEILTTLDVSKTTNKPVALLTLHASDLMLAWLNKNQIILSDKPSAYVPSSAWLYDLTKGTLTPVVMEEQGLETAWSGNTVGSSSPMGLVFAAGNTAVGGSLSLVGLSGNTINDLTLETLPSKCLFASQTSTPPVASGVSASTTATSTTMIGQPSSYLALFCAVPTDEAAFSGSRLPDAYEQGALFTQDNFYEVTISTGAITPIFTQSPTPLDARDLKIFNNVLFFVNRYDSKLYAISLSGV